MARSRLSQSTSRRSAPAPRRRTRLRRAAPGPTSTGSGSSPIALHCSGGTRRLLLLTLTIHLHAHFPRNSPIGDSDSMWSQAIFIAAMIGTARIAPGMPQMYHQKTSPMNSATVLSRIRFP